MVVLASVFVFSWLLVRRVLKENCALLAAGLTYSLFNLLLLALANASADGPTATLGLLVLCVAVARTAATEQLVWPRFSRPVSVVLGLACAVIAIYTNLSQNLFLDDDFWIHFPLQGMLAADGLPVLHPFFSEIKMNGHYGRDLLVATVTRHSSLSLLHSLHWQTTLTQVASFLTIVGLVYRSSGSQLSAVLAALFVFFGINVGGRGGLLDCYINNNALAYLSTLSLLHLFYLVYEKADAPRVMTAGLALGTFALVYETHFGLLGLLLLAALAMTKRKEFAAIGLLALLLAAVQGGPITALAKEKWQPTHRAWTPGELNQHQIIKITFPKKELFKIQLAHGEYQRRSLVYKLLPDLGSISSIEAGTPYRAIWSWDVLKIHWLVTLLAPWSLFVLSRKPYREPVGLGLWLLAAFAFLTPALVHFGPVYEFEYFRWQFAAGFGFAGAFGIAAGRVLDNSRRLIRIAVLAALAVVNLLPCPVIFFPVLLTNAKADGRIVDALWPRPEAGWILAKSQKLGGFNDSDLRAAYELKKNGKAGDRVLVNAPWSKGLDIHYEATLSAISGLRSVGHSLPWPHEAVGTPPFHRSAPAQVFWEIPSTELLDQLEVDWILLRPVPKTDLSLKWWLEKHCQPYWAHGDYRIYARSSNSPHLPLLNVSPGRPEQQSPFVTGMPSAAQTAELFRFQLRADGNIWAWAFVDSNAPPDTIDLHEVVTGRGGLSGGVTPPLPGNYDLMFYQVEQGYLQPTSLRIPFIVSERLHRRP